jgi:phosphoadenosine phosphosulfate reductase
VDIFTLDTGLFFEETYTLWKKLEERYRLTIRAVRPRLSLAEQANRFGDALWERDPDRCCELRKVLPLREALAGAEAWISALRRDQTPERVKTPLLELDEKFGLVKINPLVEWSVRDVWDYVREHDVPFNPLHEQGYPSIGCAPCTSPVRPGEDPRAGRWLQPTGS